jgi:hypothetical protein
MDETADSMQRRTTERRISRRRRMAAAAIAGSLLAIPISQRASADPEPAFIATDADWLTAVNYYRQMAGVPPVVEDPNLSAAAGQHSCYMLTNGLGHDEVPGRPGYSPAGDEAGNNGNVAVSSSVTATARRHVELWMSGPFHAIGVIRPNLRSAGFGACANEATSPWRSAATLDVLHGLAPKAPLGAPIVFPGDGTTTSLNRFETETPDPLTYCGWSGSAGLPMLALMPEAVTGPATATVSGPRGPVETCVLTQFETDGAAAQILGDENAVVVVPRSVLDPGTYRISVTTPARTVGWGFTVDPAAALGPTPAAQARPLGDPVSFAPLSPARVVDTRVGLGGTERIGAASTRFQITGNGGVPAGSRAVSANFTVVNPASTGFLTVWNCSTERPTASTSNFVQGIVTPSAGSIPLDPTGGLCVYSNASADLVIDVNGAYGNTGDQGFTPVYPARTFDTRETGTRLDDGQTVQLQLGGVHQIPLTARAVVLNITSVDPTQDGYVTAYPCGGPRPEVSNLNPHPGSALPNMVVVPLASDGTLCLFSLQDADIVVDVSGYFTRGGGRVFTATTPFRLTDTRDRSRPELQAGTGGAPAQVGQILTIPVAGVRGIPADASAVSFNLTVVDAVQEGYVTAWPCGPRPPTSTANYEAGTAISNGAMLPLSDTGSLCLFVQQQANVIIDVNGWWT